MSEIVYEGNIINETVSTINTGFVALTEAIVTKDGKIFKFISGNCIGIAVGIAVIAGGAYFIYKSLFPSSISQNVLIHEPKIPNFTPFTQDDFYDISSIGTQTFKKQHKNFSCSITKQLMREPYTLKCGHDFQKQMIRYALHQDQRCPICRRRAKFQDGVESNGLKQAIRQFRIKGFKKGKQWVENRIQQDFTSFQ